MPRVDSWFPELPYGWRAARAKHLFTRQRRAVRPEDEVVTAFRDGQVALRAKRREDGFTFSMQEQGYQGIRKGDLVVHAMDAFAGAIGVAEDDGKSTPVYSVCTARTENVHLPYYAKLLRYMALSGFIESLSKGIRERTTEFRWSDLSEVVLPVPPLAAQIHIANYLDANTAAIDALIAKKELLIEELKKYQEAVVNETLLGAKKEFEGPLKRYFRVNPSNVDKHAIEGEPPVLLCNYVDVYRNDRIEGSLPFMAATATAAQIEKLTLAAGDVLITKDSEEPTDIAVPSYVVEDLPGVVCGYHLAMLRARSADATGKYLYWVLRSTAAHTYFSGAATGVSRYALSVDDIGSLPLSLPSIVEQSRIAQRLDMLNERTKSGVALLNKSLRELKAYRAALISEAVTGKRKLFD